MKYHFYKYQAAGNDFVLFDKRKMQAPLTKIQIAQICDRRFGVGADGVITVDVHHDADFSMVYINPDGSESLCGNGCRSAVELASRLGLARQDTIFSAYDGLHKAALLANGNIRLQMNDVQEVQEILDGYSMDTGSPHYVKFVSGLEAYPVATEGREIRYNPVFPRGTNANFVELLSGGQIAIRTYERGVEEETLACGTGATAAALAASYRGYTSPVMIQARGGELAVEFKKSGPMHFTEIYLIGPAQLVFEGEIDL